MEEQNHNAEEIWMDCTKRIFNLFKARTDPSYEKLGCTERTYMCLRLFTQVKACKGRSTVG